MNIGELFKVEPDSWELHGDQNLWREFAVTFADTPLPNDSAELEQMLETAFRDATGNSLSFCSEVLVERLAKEESTRGGVSCAMWRYRFFPMIVKRFEEVQNA